MFLQQGRAGSSGGLFRAEALRNEQDSGPPKYLKGWPTALKKSLKCDGFTYFWGRNFKDGSLVGEGSHR